MQTIDELKQDYARDLEYMLRCFRHDGTPDDAAPVVHFRERLKALGFTGKVPSWADPYIPKEASGPNLQTP